MITAPVRQPAATRRSVTLPTEDAWLLWRTETQVEPGVLSVAELSECCCPDVCDRDHDND
jgi:hypothetical protein